MKSTYWYTMHKFGIRVPKTIDKAIRLDLENNNTFWMDAVQKEMSKKAQVAYTPVDEVTPEQEQSNRCDTLQEFQEIPCHIIFNITMDFTRKARFVAGGHMTEMPCSVTYSSIVSRDSVKIAFLLAALNDLDIMACNISNTYLNVPCKEKIWFVVRPECGKCAGMVCKLTRALYGLKLLGSA